MYSSSRRAAVREYGVPPDRVRILSVTAILPARDVEAALAFYEEALGFQRVFEVGEPAEYAGMRCGGAEIHFFHCEDKRVLDRAACRVRVGGIETLYETCRKRGIIHSEGALETKPWGFKEFTALDPHGIALTFYETPGSTFTYERNGTH